ncbi:hypothetical protein H4R35_004365 [Dimargaris xerosporica]|nr:hypothetical protein H4R35_004365 [Dimargaris xerosporica]
MSAVVCQTMPQGNLGVPPKRCQAPPTPRGPKHMPIAALSRNDQYTPAAERPMSLKPHTLPNEKLATKHKRGGALTVDTGRIPSRSVQVKTPKAYCARVKIQSPGPLCTLEPHWDKATGKVTFSKVLVTPETMDKVPIPLPSADIHIDDPWKKVTEAAKNHKQRLTVNPVAFEPLVTVSLERTAQTAHTAPFGTWPMHSHATPQPSNGRSNGKSILSSLQLAQPEHPTSLPSRVSSLGYKGITPRPLSEAAPGTGHSHRLMPPLPPQPRTRAMSAESRQVWMADRNEYRFYTTSPVVMECNRCHQLGQTIVKERKHGPSLKTLTRQCCLMSILSKETNTPASAGEKAHYCPECAHRLGNVATPTA